MKLDKLYYTRAIIAVLVAVLTVGVLYFFRPMSHVLPRGVILPTKHVRAPTLAKAITIYTNYPTKYQKLGAVRVELHDDGHTANAYAVMTHYAQLLASRVGANGLVVQGFYHSKNHGIADKLSSYQFYAQAIYSNA